MGFKYDIFLSYYLDDFDEFDVKWLNEFRKNLKFFSSQVLGRDVNIIDSADQPSEGVNIYAETLVFIPIITENYSDNENTYHELNTFLNSNQEIEINSLPRVIKVLKLPVKSTPAKLADFFDYKFYEYDQRSGESLSLSIENGESYQNKYWLKIMDLVNHIADIDKGVKEIDVNKKGVYLALTTPDQSNSRDVLKRELERYGLKVYPDHTLNVDSEDLDDLISKQLRNSLLSIHILGEQYGEKINNSEESLVALQNRVAATYSKSKSKLNENFDRLLWLPPSNNMMEEEQEVFIDKLNHNKESIFGGEIIKTPIESLKSIISDKIESSKIIKNTKDFKVNTYLITDISDLSAGKTLLSEIKLEGFTAEQANYDMDQHEMLLTHRGFLAGCDLPIIYYGHTNEYWLKMKLMDLSKAPGFGRSAPIEKKIIFNNTDQPIKDAFVLKSAVVINKDKKELFELISSEIRNR